MFSPVRSSLRNHVQMGLCRWSSQVRFPNCHECPVASGLGNLTRSSPNYPLCEFLLFLRIIIGRSVPTSQEILVHNHLLLLASKADDVVAGVVGPLAVVLHLDELAGAHHGEVGEDGHVREVAVLEVGELAVLQDGDRRGSW